MSIATTAIAMPSMKEGPKTSEFKFTVGGLVAWVIVVLGLVFHHDWHALAGAAQTGSVLAGPLLVVGYGLERSFVKAAHSHTLAAWWAAHAAEVKAEVTAGAQLVESVRVPTAPAPPSS